MNQSEFARSAQPRSQNEKLREHLAAHPFTWLAMPALAQVITPTGIGAAVHSRVNDCRLKLDLCILSAAKHPVTGERGSWYYYDPDRTWTQYQAEQAAAQNTAACAS